MTLPSSNQHIQYDSTGSIESMTLTSSPMPIPNDQQVLIKVKAAGVNGPDIAQRQGVYPAPKGASPILGLEVSGEIVAKGNDVTSWSIGDKVCALVPGGGYGEYAVTHQDHCLPVPNSIDYFIAAALPETLFTVWGNLFIRGGLKSEETVLIHGASGGLGNTAIKLAKAFGAHVIVTAGSAEKCHHCKQLGADDAFDYHNTELESRLKESAPQGIDVVFDMAAGDFVNLNLKLLKMDGRMVTVALKRGAKAHVDVFRLMAKRIVWTGSTLRPQSDEAKAEIANQLKSQVIPLIEAGKLTPFIHKIFLLEDAQKAHELIEKGHHVGKVVLDLTHCH
ncbi:NAD(P)H-quinone oxidoreductase [Shewanella sp. OPT22]|nr:NAD(P)H-quinone oxidoreductase [Shewanella sp. OPT22]